MRQRFPQQLFDDLPILPKLLLIPAIPFLSLIMFSAFLYTDVQRILQDEERLSDLYQLQTTTAQYMRFVSDMETAFRGYVISKDQHYLQPYEAARDGIVRVGMDLAGKASRDQEQSLEEIKRLVTKFVGEKDELVQFIKSGNPMDAMRYLAEGGALTTIAEIRKSIARFERAEQQIVQQELSHLSYDRTMTSFVILGGGLITLCFVIIALALIANSIAAPLAALSKVVGATAAEMVPSIPVIERKDEIGELARVMRKMSLQIRRDLDEVQHSEMILKKLNAHLSASEAKYRGLVDHAPVGIFMTKGVWVTFSNRYNQQLAGLDPEQEMEPDRFRQRIHPQDRDRVLKIFSQAVADGRPCETIFRFLHDDGSARTILSRHVPIMELGSTEVIYVGFNVDITTLDDLQARLRRVEKLATLGQVAAGIAHELRNPLVGIGSTAKGLLSEMEFGDPNRKEVEAILSETRRLDRIVNQIVDYARPRQLVSTRLDLNRLTEEVVRMLKPRLEIKHLTIKTSITPTIGDFYADLDQLRQVLLNIADNAIDATSEGGAPIEVTAHELFREKRPGLVIQVKDEGIGLPHELLPIVFQPFVTSGKRHGTGLGLAICKNIIDSHDGDIYVNSERGKGTIVGIWLPMKQESSLEEV
jgi:PAS domain S-box-containing protein